MHHPPLPPVATDPRLSPHPTPNKGLFERTYPGLEHAERALNKGEGERDVDYICVAAAALGGRAIDRTMEGDADVDYETPCLSRCIVCRHA